ncbi:hypothetical protein H6G89_02690 [Oscillatoria sp. FACHB-1407]|uniref:type IV pilin-like G/H family protein n=1 Tax=Oscillatoria sp. FACHB-1407 TaxID=2692847 RepID=UPI0016876E1A|nr:type IV pilin-like G/H family protein [Oscillatoria sp. FACHB-1407]MBD2459943.1 hypothetical protein [Oscillatoria sp. FACHB-1407]
MQQELNQQGFVRWRSVAIVVLVAGAIALLPGLLSCHNRMPGFMRCSDHSANLSFEGRRAFRTILRVQQAYYLDHQQFATSMAELNAYAMTGDQSPQFDYSIQSVPPLILIYSIPKEPSLPIQVRFQGLSWAERYPVHSAVLAIAPPASPDALAEGIVCENVESGVLQPATPILQNGQLTCAATTQLVDP